MTGQVEFITDEAIYKRVILDMVFSTQEFLWIGTADMKDLYVHKGKKMVPFLEILSGLAQRGTAIRLIHAKEPGPAFRKDFDRFCKPRRTRRKKGDRRRTAHAAQGK
jgi:hypothetical protein